ncbi:MAG TPA: sulfite exporter TauE/SafE family protein [Thermoanaerobaculia bacterium]|nr:sulfite exporter TauE/SafE family protein [Thermoanaerobaculia bacterium]
MEPTDILALAGAAFAAGVMNSMAGGGTILTFPTLIFLGLPAITANATSTVALLPGVVAAMAGYRKEVAAHRDWLKTLFLPSLVGGAAGSVLLLMTPEKVFANLAPLLVLFATVLFMVQGVVARRRAEAGNEGDLPDPGTLPRRRLIIASLLQLAVAVYGGYFGAGIGILMLALLGFLGLSDIHAMNGLKVFFNVCINSVAAVYFVARGAVDWPVALVLAIGAIAGGYGGARLARRIGQKKARAAVIVIGLFVTAVLFWQQLRG